MSNSFTLYQRFSAHAAEYDTHALLQAQVRAQLWQEMQPLLKADALLMDAGCGTGSLHHEAGTESFRWLWLDGAEGMCRVARQQQVRGKVICSDLNALPVRESTLDGIFSSFALQWVDSPEPVMAEMLRCLRPGGIAALAMPVAGSFNRLRSVMEAEGLRHRIAHFPPASKWQQAWQHAGGMVSRRECRTVTTFAESLWQHWRQMKAIGASSKGREASRGLTPTRRLARVVAEYEQLTRQPEGIPLEWEILFLIGRKAE
jgi:malonyl-CoA O-methyltransferase